MDARDIVVNVVDLIERVLRTTEGLSNTDTLLLLRWDSGKLWQNMVIYGRTW